MRKEEEFTEARSERERADEVGTLQWEVEVEVERPRETYLKTEREQVLARIGQKSYPPIGNQNELQPQI